MPQQPDGKTRAAVTARSRSAIMLMARLPPWLVPGVVIVLVVLGLFAPPVAGVPALALVAALVAWLGYLSWPALSPSGKTLRVVVFLIVAAAAVGKAYGRL